MLSSGATYSEATLLGHHTTNDYLYSALMGFCIVILLIIPFIKRHLLEKNEE